jgi:broad specificity phosphatase PhoE
MDLRIPVWQFVRIMVELERRASGRAGGTGSVYDEWRDAWAELDTRLTDLGDRDARAFSDLMMEQEVVVSCRSSHLPEVRRTADTLVRKMKAEVRNEADAQRKQDLRFEIRELETLARGLAKRQKKAPNNPGIR